MIPAAALIDRASFWLARATTPFVVALAAVFVVSLLLQVLSRYVFNAPLAWTEELATLLFVWATLMAAASAIRSNDMLRLTFLEDALTPGMAGLLRRCLHLLTILFGAILVWQGWRLTQLVWSDRSAAIGYPSWILYIAAPATGVMLMIHALAGLTARRMSERNGST